MQEQTLTFVPKIISIFIALLIFGSFIMGTLVNFITDLWSNFDVYIK
ncbi:MAG: flagellar biosynthetic protein FliQ [Candidatus Weimeria sp.]